MKINELIDESRISKLTQKLPTLQKKNYSDWIQSKLDEEGISDISIEDEVRKFTAWTINRLGIKTVPQIELSMDTNQAQSNPSTGQFTMDEDKIWVYINNRNLVDILRTVVHELVHFRQHELGMIKPGDSYPGSPIEAMADMLAGKMIKIYSKQNNHIYQ